MTPVMTRTGLRPPGNSGGHEGRHKDRHRDHFRPDEYVYSALRAGPNAFVVKNSGLRLLIEAVHAAAGGDSLMVMLLISLAILVPQLVEKALPPDVGTFNSPFDLPVWLNAAVVVGSLSAGTERALRLRYHWLLDGAAG